MYEDYRDNGIGGSRRRLLDEPHQAAGVSRRVRGGFAVLRHCPVRLLINRCGPGRLGRCAVNREHCRPSLD